MRRLSVTVMCAIAVVAISGCTITYKAVGRFDDYNEVFIGDVQHTIFKGGASFSVESKNSNIRCEGTAFPPYYYPSMIGCAGQRGRGNVRCSDGRRMNIEWVAKSCAQGYGEGSDKDGVTFRFVFGLDESKAQQELDRMSKEVVAKPKLPTYRPKEHREKEGFSTGTGFFVTDDGVMVTNHHVIEGAKQISVVNLAAKKEYPATVLFTDPANDVAILKIEAKTTPAPLAPDFNLRKGDEVFALGYPLITLQGQEQKATFGRVNALTGIQDDVRLVQIDVPVQPGNSGGPLFNLRGEVVGVVALTLSVVVAVRASGTLPQNVNFAVKIDYVHPTLRLLKTRKTSPPAPNAEGKKFDVPQLVAMMEPAVMLVIAK